MLSASIRTWIANHPARVGTMAGWYQQACGALAALVVLPMVVKTLNAASAGLWFSFQSLLLIINLTDFGLSFVVARQVADRKSTRLNSSHVRISYAVFCLKKKKKQ